MFWMVLMLLFVPHYSCSMSDDSSYEPFDVEAPAPGCFVDDAFSSAESDNETPRTGRSNSVYIAAVQQAQKNSGSSREMLSVDGLTELEAGVGVQVQSEDQVAQYFYNRLNGKVVPGIGLFDANDNDQCADLRVLIGLIKRISPKKYQRIKKFIGRGRSSRYANAELIGVLTKVVSSIDSLNANTTHVAKEQYDTLKLQFEIMEKRLKTEQDALALAQQNSRNTTRRYRMNTLWALIGGGVTVVVTNLLQHFLANGGTMDMTQQMQNTTMS